MYKDIFEELAFKFSNLADLKPDNIKSSFNMSDYMISDETVHNFNPSRYTFYMEFIKGLNNPDLLKNIIYENKLIASNKEEENKIIEEITKKMNLLYSISGVTTNPNILKNDELYTKLKKMLKERENTELAKRIITFLATNYDDEKNKSEKEKMEKEVNKLFEIKELTDEEKAAQAAQAAQAAPQQQAQQQAEQQKQAEQQEEQQKQAEQQEEQQKQAEQELQLLRQNVSEAIQLYLAQNMPMDQQQQLQQQVEQTLQLLLSQNGQINQKQIDQIQKALQELQKLQRQNASFDQQQSQAEKLLQALQGQLISGGGGDDVPKNTEDDKEDLEPKDGTEELSRRVVESANNINKAKNMNDNEQNKMESNLKLIRENFKKNSHLYNFRNKLKTVLETPSVDTKVKASKLRDIIIEIEEDQMTSINNLKITKEDRLVFIGITFILRLISLLIIDWSLNTNFCVTFTQAYLLWLGLYSIFLLICIVIVNITYNYPIFKLYEGNHSLFTSIASTFYYFYFIPGNILSSSYRIIAHFAIIIFLTTIAILIVDKKGESVTLNYDYAEKKNIRKSLSDFTLVLWLFTSSIAMYI